MLTGPCEGCGEEITKYFRKDRRFYCTDCAIEAGVAHNRAMADGTSPMLEKCRQSGAEAAQQIRDGKGPHYDRWVRGMQRHLAHLEAQHPVAP